MQAFVGMALRVALFKTMIVKPLIYAMVNLMTMGFESTIANWQNFIVQICYRIGKWAGIGRHGFGRVEPCHPLFWGLQINSPRSSVAENLSNSL